MGCSFIPMQVSKRLWKKMKLFLQGNYIFPWIFLSWFVKHFLHQISLHTPLRDEETWGKAEVLCSSLPLSWADSTSLRVLGRIWLISSMPAHFASILIFTLNLGSSWAGNMKLTKWRHEFLMDFSKDNKQSCGHMEQSTSLFYKASCSFTLCCSRKLKLHMVPVILGFGSKCIT